MRSGLLVVALLPVGAAAVWKPESSWAVGENGKGYPVPSFSCCSGAVTCSGAGCRLRQVKVDFGKLARGSGANNLWDSEVLTYPLGALSVKCGVDVASLVEVCPLEQLRGQFHLSALLNATSGTHDAAPRFAAFLGAQEPSDQQSQRRLALVYRDVDNLFHQAGSAVATAEYLMQLDGSNFLDRDMVEIAFLDKHNGSMTQPMFSPGLAKQSWTIAEVPSRLASYNEVLLPMSAQPHWWWDLLNATSRKGFFDEFTRHVLEGVGGPPSGGASEDGIITILQRPGKRRLLKHALVIEAVERALPGHRVELVEFSGAIPWHEQLLQIRRSKLLISTHGAGLTWSMFLPRGSGVLEIIGGQSHQTFFKALCAWQLRPYRRHQDNVYKNSSDDWTHGIVAEPNEVARLARELILSHNLD